MLIETLKEKYNKYINTIIILDFQLYRFVDIFESSGYVYNSFDDGNTVKTKLYVSDFTFLKNNISTNDYQDLVKKWNIKFKNKAD